MITEDYVSRETYKLLKEKGYDGEFKTCYDMEGYTYPAIHLYDAMKWLREVHNINLNIYWNPTFKDYYVEMFKPTLLYSTTTYQNYEKACEAAIKYVLENLI